MTRHRRSASRRTVYVHPPAAEASTLARGARPPAAAAAALVAPHDTQARLSTRPPALPARHHRAPTHP